EGDDGRRERADAASEDSGDVERASLRGRRSEGADRFLRPGNRCEEGGVDRRLDFLRGQAALVTDVIDGGGLEGLAHRHALLGDDLDTAVRFGYENAVGPPDVGLEGERGPSLPGRRRHACHRTPRREANPCASTEIQREYHALSRGFP